jgi:hypothetical protein
MTIPADLTIEFETDKFDFRSELPAEYNAGNRFYGRDVAEYLCAGLETFGVLGEFMDEDWGWLILAHENTDPMIEISIYHWEDDDTPVQNRWRLRVSSYVHNRFMYFFRKRRNVPNGRNVVAALRSLFQGSEFNVTVFGARNDW